MERAAAFARQYGLEILVAALLLAGLIKLSVSDRWWPDLTPALIALFGGVSVFFPEEVARTTGRYGWTRAQGWQDPPGWVRGIGVVLVLGGVGTILAR